MDNSTGNKTAKVLLSDLFEVLYLASYQMSFTDSDSSAGKSYVKLVEIYREKAGIDEI